MELKSVVSSHTSSLDEITRIAGIVTKDATLVSSTYVGLTHIATYKLGENIYNLTFVNDTLVAFELKGVYCFRTLL